MIIGFSFEIARSPKIKDLLATMQQVMNQQLELNQLVMQPPQLVQPPEPEHNHFAPTKIPVMTEDELNAKKRRQAAAKKAAATRKKNKKAAEAAKSDDQLKIV